MSCSWRKSANFMGQNGCLVSNSSRPESPTIDDHCFLISHRSTRGYLSVVEQPKIARPQSQNTSFFPSSQKTARVQLSTHRKARVHDTKSASPFPSLEQRMNRAFRYTFVNRGVYPLRSSRAI